MPRDGLGQYAPPPGTQGIPNYTVESARYNTFVADITQDLNLPRPIVAGGTGASTPDGALDGLSAEKFKQVVTDWSGMVWRAGSFYAASTATGTAPVAGHAFAGIAYYANATDFVLEATDLTDPINPTKYIRIMVSGVWGNWLLASGGSTTGDYTFDNTITFPPASGQIRFNNAVENSTTEIFISHLNALGVDLTGTLSASLKSGYDIFVQDKDEPTKYKIFTATAAPVVSGGDFRILVALKTAGVDIVSGQRVVTSISTGSAVVYDVAQGLTANQQSQARSNIGVTKRNYITNGAMMVSQEWGTTGLAGSGQFPVDMFNYQLSATTGATTFGQIGGLTPGGSPNRIICTVTTADASVGASDLVLINHVIEGLRWADLKAGTAAAKTVTIQFGVKAPAGTYCVSLRNGAANRSYIAEYTIAAGEANTDVMKSVTLTLDTTGTWATDNTAGVYIAWTLMCGTTGQTTANAWTAGNFFATSNQFNFMGTFGNVFQLFDVSLTEGNVAPPFMVPDYTRELALCKRYWQKFDFANSAVILDNFNNTVSGNALLVLPFSAMRAAPTGAVIGAVTTINLNSVTPTFTLTATAAIAGWLVTASGRYAVIANASGTSISLNARL